MSGLLKLVPAWAWAALAGLLLATIVGGAQEIRVSLLHKQLQAEVDGRLEDAGKLGACRETRGTLLVQLSEQNQAMASLRQATAARAALAEQTQKEAGRAAEHDYQAANRLQRERTGGDACVASEAVINQELGL
ncbi:hypothetical protein SAMN05878276_0428 [Aquipseudomonas alcaligenes]|uniref:hypothetical protein n=1 Tax=Aquipseudomonas alcaligenes TaxID=43263 RepID=UPI000954009D|nr:hypothetical protein [Pseudomonas alcaligenes]SIR82785.1 hypothetical protein SAMN05878276_0428 [Pseudomonas alcaligenes]